MSRKPKGLKKLLSLLGVTALLWGIYSLCVTLCASWIFWVYVALFGISAVAYIILLGGDLTIPPEEPPEGVDPAAFAAYRERLLEKRRRYSLLPYLTFGSLFCILLDYINLTWFGGIFL